MRFVRAAAFELGGAGIRINAIRPGLTVSPEAAASGQYAGVAAETPLGRVGVPDDLARVVRFLAGPEAGWVTGQTFSVDGGGDQGKAADMMDMFFGKEVMDRIRAGDFQPLLGWLQSRVHRFGRMYLPSELLQRVVGGGLDSGPLLRYLNRKYGELYDLG